jgi:TRAP-type transport system periplasmic protein
MKRLVLKSIVAAVAVAAFGMASAQDIKERTIKFGVAGPETHPAVPGMKKFAEAVTAKSGGKIKVNLFFNSSLGTDQAIVSAIKGGTVEMSVMNSGILASEAKELALFDFPFLFANERNQTPLLMARWARKCTHFCRKKASWVCRTGNWAIAT